MEPGLGEVAVGRHHDAARLVYRLANPVVDRVGVVGLGLLHVGGDVRALIAGGLAAQKLHREGSGEDCLRLQGLDGPGVLHFTRDHAHDVGLQIHLLDGLRGRVVHLQQRNAVRIAGQALGDLRHVAGGGLIFLVRAHAGAQIEQQKQTAQRRQHSSEKLALSVHIHHLALRLNRKRRIHASV